MFPDECNSLADKFSIRFLLMPSTGPGRMGYGMIQRPSIFPGSDNLYRAGRQGRTG
jgi:hypothetical protein